MGPGSHRLVAVRPHVHRLEWQLGSRRIAQWLIDSGGEVLLVDTGVHGTVTEHVLPALTELGLSATAVRTVLITHADVDHYGGNAEARRAFPQAKILCGQPDRPLVESWATILRERYGWYDAFGLSYPAATLDWLREAAGPDTTIDGTVQDGQRVSVGSLEVEVMALPGHTLGHIGVLIEGDTAVVADAVLERGLYDIGGTLISPPPYVTAVGYRETIDRLSALNLERLETAHYPEIHGRQVARFLNDSRDFHAALDTLVGVALEADPNADIPALTALADARFGPFREMANELARTVGAHLAAQRPGASPIA